MRPLNAGIVKFDRMQLSRRDMTLASGISLGTTPWMGLVNRGLTDPERLDWGGWSGRFSRNRHRNIYSRHQDVRRDEQTLGEFRMFEADSEVEAWTDPIHDEQFTGHYVPVWRFRRAMFNDFRGRMDWCVKTYDDANHNPVAATAMVIVR